LVAKRNFCLQVPIKGTMVPFMGTNGAGNYNLGDALFSKTQRQVLSLLFGNSDKSFYVREIVRSAGVGVGTVQRELEKLSRVGLLTIKKIGNQKHYQANRESPIFEELKGIVQKTFGLADVLRNVLDDYREKIKAAFIYGSVAKGTDKSSSDIDIMIVSDELSYVEVLETFSVVETKLGRRLNPVIYNTDEFQEKITTDNSFVTRVTNQQKIFLIGSENDITTV
jgi:predicted nucleotidyltransferase